jgi:hypothetical protein
LYQRIVYSIVGLVDYQIGLVAKRHPDAHGGEQRAVEFINQMTTMDSDVHEAFWKLPREREGESVCNYLRTINFSGDRTMDKIVRHGSF